MTEKIGLGGGVVGALEPVMYLEVLELIQQVLSLVGVPAQRWQKVLQARFVANVAHLGVVQQASRVRQLGLDLLGVVAELEAVHVRCHRGFGQHREHLAEQRGRWAESRRHLQVKQILQVKLIWMIGPKHPKHDQETGPASKASNHVEDHPSSLSLGIFLEQKITLRSPAA